MVAHSKEVAEREKRGVALSSVIAALFLTGLKIVVGILTNSLGILSEAAHSGLDLIAAGVTFFAVRVSDRPPDREHPYGHGKIENLSALVETLLLLVTCVWIIYEAISRLIEPVHIDVNVWSFLVMGTSIVIDVSRSRALMRVAKKHKSQALEADALHFSTDVWSSSVVILGLIAVRLSQWFEANSSIRVEWLYHADSIAALGVSAIVIYVSFQLGRRTVAALLDSPTKGAVEQVEMAVEALPGVTEVRRVRVRESGPATFVDMTLAVPRSVSLEEAHHTATEAEAAVERLFRQADVMVRITPVVGDAHSLVEEIRSVAARQKVGVHGIRAYDVRGHLSLEMHIEVPESLTITQAHARVSSFEGLLREEIPQLEDVVTHIEPVGDEETRRQAIKTSSDEIRRTVTELLERIPGVKGIHDLNVHSEENELSISFHCLVDPEIPIGEAHQLTIEIEARIRSIYPELGRIVIHTEPLSEAKDDLSDEGD